MKKIILILTNVFILCTLNAQTKTELIDRLFSYYNQNGMFNGIVLVAENGVITYNKAFGFSDYENKTPFKTDDVFAIGSITKPITATAIMILKERNLISYDDKLSKYFPELPEAASNVSIKNLLTHSSGIPDYRSRKFGIFKLPVITQDTAYKTIYNNFNLLFEPGTSYSYSNSNYMLLALIIEKITGISYRNFLQQNIFDLCNMNSCFVNDGLYDSIPNRVNGYSYYWNKTDYDLKNKAYGDGSTYSTITDLFLFDQALYSNKLLSEETLKEAYDFSKYLETNRGYRYGLGWRIIDNEDGRNIVAHRGALGGFKSLLWRDVKNKNTLIILSNNWWLVETPEIISGAQNIMENKEYVKAKISVQALFLDNWYIHGFDAALQKVCDVYSNAPDQYNYSEDLLNNLGYYFIYSRNEPQYAKKIIEYALEIYPESDELWDSLGEMNSILNNKNDAIDCYERSLKLNSDNENAKQKLKEIKVNK